MTEFEVKNGMRPEFEKLSKNDFSPALKKAGVKECGIFKPDTHAFLQMTEKGWTDYISRCCISSNNSYSAAL